MASGIDARELTKLVVDLEQQERRMKGLSKPIKASAQDFRILQEKTIFGKGIDWQAEKWEPLSDATINNRRGKHSKVSSASVGLPPVQGPKSYQATVKQKRKGSKSKKPKKFKPFTGKTLVDTGALKRSVFSKGTKDEIVFGVSGAPLTYAGTHQFGRDRMKEPGLPFGGAPIPARPFLPVDASGELVPATRGPIKTLTDKIRNRVLNWVLYGVVSADERVQR